MKRRRNRHRESESDGRLRETSKCRQPMTAAEAVVATLVAHGLDTVYALPGVQNDLLFEALFKFSDRLRTVHTRHEQGAAYMALGAALATGKPQAYAVVPGPGFLNSVGGAAHRLFHECAGAGADRANPRRRYRQGPRPSARDPRPDRHHQAAGRSLRADPQARAGRARDRAGAARDADRPAGTGGARMRHRRLGQVRAGRDAGAAADPRARRSTWRRSAAPPSGLARRSGR